MEYFCPSVGAFKGLFRSCWRRGERYKRHIHNNFYLTPHLRTIKAELTSNKRCSALTPAILLFYVFPSSRTDALAVY